MEGNDLAFEMVDGKADVVQVLFQGGDGFLEQRFGSIPVLMIDPKDHVICKELAMDFELR